jgi:hypothetical protein
LSISEIIQEKISGTDWQSATKKMNEKGYALVTQFLPVQYCEELICKYDSSALYRKTITMDRYRFGVGEYKYFNYPLPPLSQIIREKIYPRLAFIANKWMIDLKIDKQFPATFSELQNICHENNQDKPTVLSKVW